MRLPTMIAASMMFASAALAQSVLRVPEQYGSIQTAINASVDGDTVLVSPGTWGRVSFSDKRITLRSTSGPWATVINAGGSGRAVHIDDFNAVTIEGFMLTGGNAREGGGMYAYTSTGGSLTMRQCVIYNNTSETGPGGIQLRNVRSVFEDCWFLNNSCPGNDVGGLQLMGGGPHLIKGCVFANNYCWFWGAALEAGAGNSSRVTTIVNCTFDNNVSGSGQNAITASSLWVPIRIYNSVVRTPDGTSSIQGGLSDVQVRRSNFEGLPGGFDYGGNIDADPLFVDPVSNDYRLLPGSPSIDAGDSTILPEWFDGGDFFGLPRYANDPATPDTGVGGAFPGVIDMGAHEYQTECDGDFILDAAATSEPFPGSGTALSLDGINDRAVVEGFLGIPAGECTFEFWSCSGDWGVNGPFGFTDCDNPDEAIQVILPWADGFVYWTHGNTNSQWYATLQHKSSPLPQRAQVWTHWAFVIEPSTNSTVIYRNGRVVEKRAGWGTYNGADVPLVIGDRGDPDAGCLTAPFKGLIDEFRVWDVARTEAEIAGNMSLPLAGDEPGLIAYYPFDEGAGETAANYSLNVNQPVAELRNGAGWHDPYLVDGDGDGVPEACDDCDGDGRFDPYQVGPFHGSLAALTLDGNGAHAANEHDPDFSIAGESFTVEGWVFRGPATGNEEFFFFHGTEGSANRGLVIGFRATDHLTFAFWGNDLDTYQPIPRDDRWHHWACTYDATTNERRIYADGGLVARDTATADFQGTGTIRVGGLGSGAWFRGTVDEIRVWDHARTQAEIRADMFREWAWEDVPDSMHAYYKANNTNGEWYLLDWAGQNDLLPDGGAGYQYFAGDCNGNGVPDACDPDSDGDGIPDDCECAADFNNDGDANTLDVLSFLNAWTAGDSSADMNGDGTVNTLDVLVFLNLWTAGC